MKLAAALLCLASVADATPKKKAVPAAIVVLVDRSGSMKGPRLDAVKAATDAVIDAIEADDAVAVIAFDSEAKLVELLTKPGKDRTPMHAAVDKIDAGGGTNLLPPLKLAYEQLEGLEGVRKHVILFTDGEAPYDGISDVMKQLRDHGDTVSCVGVGDADRNLLSLIADNGEGRLYMVEDLKSLPKIFIKELDTVRAGN